MTYLYQDFLEHYGVKGQKHGQRRFQNEDGTLTEEGKAHYAAMYGDAAQATREHRDKIQAQADKLHNKIEAKKTKMYSKYDKKIQKKNEAISELRRAGNEIKPRKDFYEGVAKDTEAQRDRLKAKADAKAAKIDSKYAKKTAKYEKRIGEQNDAIRQLTEAQRKMKIGDIQPHKKKKKNA